VSVASRRGRRYDVIARGLLEKVPRDHWETDEMFRRRRRTVLGTAVGGAALLGVSLSTPPDSKEFYGLTLGVAGIWTLGALRSGPLHLGYTRTGASTYRRPVLAPAVIGVGAFGAFYGAALAAKRIPVLDRAIASVLTYANQGNDGLVLATTLANGVAEEVFFRGALYSAVGANQPVARSTAAYMLATATTRNPALVLASGVMGALFGLQRRASGGVQAPMITHVVWSTLMLRFLPPLFRRHLTPIQPQSERRPGRGWA
jgi:membrane protease YdiL (CAAX protease family)